MNAPDLCPQCLSANIIAPLHGPTCAHSVPNGVRWWPDGWERMPEGERVAWLKTKADK
jgi:hypothetical protein